MSHTSQNGSAEPNASLTVAWEQQAPATGRPIAVEFTFTPAPDEQSPVPPLPLNVGLAVDRSGSMAGPKLAAARRAALGVLEGLHDGERFAAAAFESEVTDVSPNVCVDDTVRARVRGNIAELEAGGSTALFDGFTRAAELAAAGGRPAECDSWVIVLSDGMGNAGLTDPATMKTHAGALADRGIRTITIGIGDDYEASQLTALADGGAGEFHHASKPDEIVEIVLGELRSLRSIAARDLRLHVTVGGTERWLLLGGQASQVGQHGDTRFDRVNTGRVMRAVALLWPSAESNAQASVEGDWLDAEQHVTMAHASAAANGGPAKRDVALATRAARLWHAQILTRALELNEQGHFEEAESGLGRQRKEFEAYVQGLPEMDELVRTLRRTEGRVGRMWRTAGHREAYVMARKAMLSKFELRDDAPMSYSSALDLDERRGGGRSRL